MSKFIVLYRGARLGCIGLVFVDRRTKVNSAYYRNVLLSKQLLPVIRHIDIDFFFTFSSMHNAPADSVRETVELLRNKTPDFVKPDLWPPDSPDPSPMEYKI